MASTEEDCLREAAGQPPSVVHSHSHHELEYNGSKYPSGVFTYHSGESAVLNNHPSCATEAEVQVRERSSPFRPVSCSGHAAKTRLNSDHSQTCRYPVAHHYVKSGSPSDPSNFFLNVIVVALIGFFCCGGAFTFAAASPPHPIVRPPVTTTVQMDDDMCEKLNIHCVHGTCYNDSQPQCECERGWMGSACDTCGGRMKVTDTSGYIIDGYANYTTNTKCTWLIEPPTVNTMVRLRFLHFATECTWDHLYIYEGDSVFDKQIAAYSGLVMPTPEYEGSMPEIVIKGYAYLHFYSDAAYNMSGFNISYTMGASCPLDCSGNGACDSSSGNCSCSANWTGPGCQYPACPKNCSGDGQCVDKVCQCSSERQGYDCSLSSSDGWWQAVSTKYSGNPPSPPTPRASHKHVVYKDKNDDVFYLYVFYGFNFNYETMTDSIVRFNFDTSTWESVDVTTRNSSIPSPRYGHSVALYKDTVYMYGGQLIESGNITKDLWEFDLKEKVWSSWAFQESVKYFGVVGHVCHVIDQTMYVIFGHNPHYGYVNYVQEFNISSQVWSVVSPDDVAVKGGYGQSSVYDEQEGLIYIHGGYVSTTPNTYSLSDALYAYDPIARTWEVLVSSGQPKFLHSAVFLNGFMFVYGGNTHNDTSISKGAKCYSSNFLAFDPLCNQWQVLDPPYLLEDISRYGHSAGVYNNKMFMFGGFNGQVLDDLYFYTPPSCTGYAAKSVCQQNGKSCVWAVDRCVPNASSQCPTLSPEEISSACNKYVSCRSCVKTSRYNCDWCNSQCVNSASAKDSCQASLVVSSVDQCPANTSGTHCRTVHNCNACVEDPSCHWSSTKCNNSVSVVTEKAVCSPSCHLYDDCTECTSSGCMWCGSEKLCFASMSYVASFPYGQCMEWTTDRHSCPATDCPGLSTCESCQSSPACGWCDDGSNTGLGQCVQGSYQQPSNPVCQTSSWFFDSCPRCQCNGHSQCYNNTDVCINCQDQTMGDQCEMCVNGYFGDPSNGGNCSACQCNGQADYCDNVSGRCYCNTRGVDGDHCDQCEETSKYYGDPANGGTCFYILSINYKFTFNLTVDKEYKKYYTHTNFLNEPPNAEQDLDFSIKCSSETALMNITVRVRDSPTEDLLVAAQPCANFEEKFLHSEIDFGAGTNTTFYVYVYDFTTPFVVEITFLQLDPIDLIHFFITFFSCFLSLLLIAAVVWKVKQKCDMYRRRQRMVVEMEQMASRPFTSCNLDVPMSLEEPFLRQEAMNAAVTITNTNSRASQRLKKAARARYSPSPVALEPLKGNKAAVLTLFIRMPTGDEEYTPKDQLGLSVGSALVTIGSYRKNSGDAQQRLDKNAKPRKPTGGDGGESNCV